METGGTEGGLSNEEVPAFETLVDNLPEKISCPRRMHEFGPWEHVQGLDYWQQFKSNGNRVCSFCGSLHPGDMFELVKRCAEAPADAAYDSVVEIELTDKRYKVYVHQPGVRNAHEGGIKFYMDHLLRAEDGTIAVTPQQNDEFNRAVRASKRRFNTYLESIQCSK